MYKSPAWASFIDVKIAEGVIAAVSKARLSKYGMLNPLSKPMEVVAEHGRNITLCEAMYPALHMLEVVMRNSIHNAFAEHYGSNNWYDQPWLNDSHAELVAKAKSDLAKQRKQENPDRVVAKLTFGFWCGMFHHSYESATGPWPKLLSKVCPRVPKSWRSRDKVQGRIEKARKIRNQVFHHECISKLPDLRVRHRELIELLGWFSVDARQHVEHLCRFHPVMSDHLEVSDE